MPRKNKIKTQKIGNSERMIISGDTVKSINMTSSAMFAGLNVSRRAHKSLRDYTRKPKHKGRNIQIDC
jgi:hypothetical protein